MKESKLRKRIHRYPMNKPSEFIVEANEKDSQMATKYKGMTITAGRHKLNGFWSILYIGVWIALYFTAVYFPQLPKALKTGQLQENVEQTLQRESEGLENDLANFDTNNNLDMYKGKFVAERAYANLQKLVSIGPRIVGTPANEQSALDFLILEVDKIIRSTNASEYTIETDTQISSGGYFIWNLVNRYQGITNFIVKLTPKQSTSNSSLLINSHFDTVPGSPGAGDDGTMVVVMLEVLRAIVGTPNNIQHSIVFLFNGAEENPLQGSHAFITKHKWAGDVKAFINLDSAGNGGREILFQSGPNHSWLMKYYKKVPHPFGAVLAEELFQRDLIPSDTDFRIFRDFGRIPGLDLAHSYNGYVYHTQYDRIETIPQGTLQHTGDNILELAKGLANAPELENVADHIDDQAVYFDFYGLFFISYTKFQGKIINFCVIGAAIIAICISLFVMSNNSGLSIFRILLNFLIIFVIQVSATIVAALVCLSFAFLLDSVGKILAWYSNPWLIFGIYGCPFIFILGMLPAFYLEYTKDNSMLLCHKIQMFLHAQCILLIILLAAGYNIRTTCFIMIAVLFYTVAVYMNLITTFHNKPFLWLIPLLIGQVIPFLFFAYESFNLIVSFVPMAGRSGATTNPELLISALCVVFSLLAFGFLIPVVFIFRRPRLIILVFCCATIAAFIMIFTPLGFPFRESTSPQRHFIMHTKRTFYTKNGTIRRADSGFLVLPMDRISLDKMKEYSFNFTFAKTLDEDCKSEFHCGLPIYTNRMLQQINDSRWIPAGEPDIYRAPKLALLAIEDADDVVKRYKFELSGPDHMTISIALQPDVRLIDWSFSDIIPVKFLKKNSPYLIYFSYGTNPDPLQFHLEIVSKRKPQDNKSTEENQNNLFSVGIAGHLIHHRSQFTDEYKKFLNSFPKWCYKTSWISTYDNWQF